MTGLIHESEGVIGASTIHRQTGKRGPSDRESQPALFLEQAPVAFAVFDTGMRFLSVSRLFLVELASLFSTRVFSPAEVIGRTQYEIFPGFPQRWRDIHARVLEGEELAEEEDFLPRKKGGAEWIRWSMKPWRTADGRIGGALLFSEVVTAEVKARHALAESEERFRATFENAAVGISHLDPDLRWVRANKALCRIVGWPIDELVTKSLRDISHPDDLADELEHIELMRQGKIDSYALEKRYLRKDGSTSWGRLTISCVRRSDGSLDYFVRVVEDISARKRAEERAQLLMREANHRAKNILSLVQAIARQTATHSPEDFVDRFTERLRALAANQDLLVRHKWQGIEVDDLVRAQLAPFADLIGPRIAIGGPQLRLNAAAAQALGLTLHELATNAGKYGALSTDAGRVDIGWRLDGETFAMNWIERNGPPVRPPERQGFGTTVTRVMAARAVDGEVRLDYAPPGLEWRLACPAANALERR